MFTGQRKETPTASPAIPSPRPRVVRSWVVSVVLLGTSAVLTMAFFLIIYRAHQLSVPLGWDTSKYIWRTTLVRAFGIAGQAGHVAPPGVADPSRPGFPVIALTLGSVLHATTFQMAAVLPAVSAAAIGLAAGTFLGVTLRLSRWEVVVASLLVGTSAFVVRLAAPETYQDNLFASAVFMAAATAFVIALEDRRTIIPAALLFGAGGVIHWAFFIFMVATVALAAATYVPQSLRTWRSGRGLIDTPAARLGTVVLGGTVVGGATIFGLLTPHPQVPKLSQSEFTLKLHRDIPKYRFPITLPLAAIGGAALASPGRWSRVDRRRGRFLLTFLLAWCAVVLAGLLGYVVFHSRVPAHRFLSYALAVPVLAVVGVLWLARWAARWRALAAAGLLAVGLGGAGYASHVLWFQSVHYIDPNRVEEAATASSYLDAAHVGGHRPVIFLVGEADASSTALMTHIIRSVLPAARIDDAYIYIGSPANYLGRRPSPRLSGAADPLSQHYFGFLEPTYDRDPVALILRSFDEPYFGSWVRAHAESLVAPNVAVVTGPPLNTALPPPSFPVGGLGPIRVGLLAVGSLAILSGIGLGWVLGAFGRWLSPLEMLAVAPAVGIAALVMFGLLVDAAGIRLGGAGGVAVPVGGGVGGWAVAVLRSRRSR